MFKVDIINRTLVVVAALSFSSAKGEEIPTFDFPRSGISFDHVSKDEEITSKVGLELTELNH